MLKVYLPSYSYFLSCGQQCGTLVVNILVGSPFPHPEVQDGFPKTSLCQPKILLQTPSTPAALLQSRPRLSSTKPISTLQLPPGLPGIIYRERPFFCRTLTTSVHHNFQELLPLEAYDPEATVNRCCSSNGWFEHRPLWFYASTSTGKLEYLPLRWELKANQTGAFSRLSQSTFTKFGFTRSVQRLTSHQTQATTRR